MTPPVRVLIVAGEASGDQHAAALVASLSSLRTFDWFGMGGEAMQAAGVELVEHARVTSVIGLFEVLAHVPRIFRAFRCLLREVDRRQPRLAILVDLPGFNLHLARALHRRGIPVVYFIAPQIWAWRPRRVRSVRRYVRKLLCIFPFEEVIYRRARVNVEHVGHPLVGRAVPTMTRREFFAAHGLEPARPLVCLLPGSRPQEIARHLSRLASAARLLRARHGAQFVLVRAPTVDPAVLQRELRDDLVLRVIEGPVYNALAASNVAVISSGTATVEAALLDTPMVVIYRVAPLSWWLGRWMILTPFYSMVNLIAGERLVPELIQEDFTPERLADEVSLLLTDADRQARMKRGLCAVRQRLGEPGAIERASRAIVSLLPEAERAPVVS